MEKRKYDAKTIMLILILFLSNIGTMGGSVRSVVMTEMYANLDAWAINLTMALPGVMGLITCLIAGKVVDRINKKKELFICGLVLFSITGSVFGGLLAYSNIGQIVTSCISGGICYGMISVSTIGLIADYFQNEEQRSQVMGWYNGAMAAVGAVLALIYGNLAVIHWTYAFNANWMALPVAVLAFFFIPASSSTQNNTGESKEKVRGEKGWANRLIPILFAFFFVSIAYMTFLTYIDLYVSGNQLGDSSFTGLLSSIGTICSFIACSSFGFTYKKLKNNITLLTYALLSVGILTLYLVPEKAIAMIVCGIMGAAWGTTYTYWFFRSTVVVPEYMVGTATGLVTAVNSLSYFPIPYLLTFLMTAVKTDNITAILPFYAGIAGIVFIIAVIYKFSTRKA